MSIRIEHVTPSELSTGDVIIYAESSGSLSDFTILKTENINEEYDVWLVLTMTRDVNSDTSLDLVWGNHQYMRRINPA